MAEGHSAAFYLGPDAWAKRDDSSRIAHQLGDALMAAGAKVPYPIQASNDHVGGAHMMYKKLRDGDACRKLIESMPQLIHDDPPHQEDVKKVVWTESQLGDDPYDSARYGLYSHFSTSICQGSRMTRRSANISKCGGSNDCDPATRFS